MIADHSKYLLKNAIPILNLEHRMVLSPLLPPVTSTITSSSFSTHAYQPSSISHAEIAEDHMDEDLDENKIQSLPIAQTETTEFQTDLEPHGHVCYNSVKVKQLKTRVNNLIKEKKNLYQKNRRLVNSIKNLKSCKDEEEPTVDKFIEQCDIFLNPQAATIVKAQLNQKHYSNEMKNMCLTMYLSSS